MREYALLMIKQLFLQKIEEIYSAFLFFLDTFLSKIF